MLLSKALQRAGLHRERLGLVRGRIGDPYRHHELLDCLSRAGKIDELGDLVDVEPEDQQAHDLCTAFHQPGTVEGNGDPAAIEQDIENMISLYERYPTLATYRAKYSAMDALVLNERADRLARFMHDNRSDPQVRDADILMGTAYAFGLTADLGTTPFPTGQWQESWSAAATNPDDQGRLLSNLLRHEPDILLRRKMLSPPALDTNNVAYSNTFIPTRNRSSWSEPRLCYFWKIDYHHNNGSHFIMHLNPQGAVEIKGPLEQTFPATPQGWLDLMDAVNTYATGFGGHTFTIVSRGSQRRIPEWWSSRSHHRLRPAGPTCGPANKA